jgi:hypothetical protein
MRVPIAAGNVMPPQTHSGKQDGWHQFNSAGLPNWGGDQEVANYLMT